MNKLKTLIISVFIAIITIFIFIISLVNNKSDSNESDFKQTEFEQNDTFATKQEIIKVKNKNKYFAVEKILNTYIYYIKEVKGIIDFQKYDDIEIKNDGISKLYNILDTEYISELGIKKEELEDKVKEYENYNLKINEMYVYEKTSSINIFFVYATIDNDELNLIIKTDSANMTYSIFLDDYIHKKSYNIYMDINDIEISNDEIKKNQDNQYKYVNITDEYVAIQYMKSLKENILNNIDKAYNMLDNEYKEKRFKNKDNFIKYINDNREELENIDVKKYMINNYEDYKEFVCIDQYNNYYIFKENAIMDYTFKLDTYTLISDKFKETYKNANDTERVQLNVDKFIKMMNSHDYDNIYKYLSEGFKENYFKTEEEFEEYIKSIFYRYNKVTYKDVTKKGSDIYTANIEIEDLTGKNEEKKEFNIIIQLIDETKFVMSFGI